MSPAKKKDATKGDPAPLPDDPVTRSAATLVDERLPGAIEETVANGLHPFIRVKAERLRDVCQLLRDAPETQLDCCHLVSGVDRPADEVIEVVYHLVSYALKPDEAYRKRKTKNDPWVALKVRLPREKPEVPTVSDIWTGADWHERETYDLVGVIFTGRAELRRILLPEDWPGHPLQKDWKFPVAYHGIPIIPPEAQP